MRNFIINSCIFFFVIVVTTSCKECPTHKDYDYNYNQKQQNYINNIANKKISFIDNNNNPFFITTSSPTITPDITTESAEKGGMLSCKPPIPRYTKYKAEIIINSNIPNFNWNKIIFQTSRYNDIAIILTSIDTIIVPVSENNPKAYKYNPTFSGYESNDSITSAKFFSEYNSIPNVNGITTHSTIQDTLFWSFNTGFIKFTNKDKQAFYRKY